MTKTRQKALPRMALRGKKRRPLEDRLAMHFPTLATRIFAWFTRLTLRMPRHWHLRQLLVEFSACRAYNAIGRGDLAVLRTINHADAIYDLSGWQWPEDSHYYGRDGVVRFNELWIGQWSKPNFDVVSVKELDECGVFLIHVRLRGIGRASNAEVEMDNFQLVKIREGLIWHNTFFRSAEEAVEAARIDRAATSA